jgi:hypothetical protein
MRQLGEGHAEPLIPAGETPQFLICSIARHALLKFPMRKKLHQLRKHRSAKIHSPLFYPANFKSFLCQHPLNHCILAISQLYAKSNRTAVGTNPNLAGKTNFEKRTQWRGAGFARQKRNAVGLRGQDKIYDTKPNPG